MKSAEEITGISIWREMKDEREIRQTFEHIATGELHPLTGWTRIYHLLMPSIAARHPDQIYPYFCDWTSYISPIEWALWEAIRTRALPMYPQVPACNAIFDFADPIAKIGIECDGAAYHQNKAKDAARDAKLIAAGWTIYRIPGSECVRCGDDYDWCSISQACAARDDDIGEHDEDFERSKYRTWLMNSGDGVMHAVAHRHYQRCDGLDRFSDLVAETLMSHKSTGKQA